MIIEQVTPGRVDSFRLLLVSNQHRETPDTIVEEFSDALTQKPIASRIIYKEDNTFRLAEITTPDDEHRGKLMWRLRVFTPSHAGYLLGMEYFDRFPLGMVSYKASGEINSVILTFKFPPKSGDEYQETDRYNLMAIKYSSCIHAMSLMGNLLQEDEDDPLQEAFMNDGERRAEIHWNGESAMLMKTPISLSFSLRRSDGLLKIFSVPSTIEVKKEDFLNEHVNGILKFPYHLFSLQTFDGVKNMTDPDYCRL